MNHSTSDAIPFRKAGASPGTIGNVGENVEGWQFLEMSDTEWTVKENRLILLDVWMKLVASWDRT